MKISFVRIKELAAITGLTPGVISKYFKEETEGVIRVNSRVSGIAPNAAHVFLKKNGATYLEKGGVFLSANLCGGVGKTSGIFALSCCMRRLMSTDIPIIIIDTDSQGSLTSSIFGEPASNDEPILVDYLEGRVTVKEILHEIDNNIWCIKSNLNQVYLDKVLSKATDIKNKMKFLYEDIFSYLGVKAKIFQDHSPQLSSVFASSVCALFQMPSKFYKVALIPMRSDKYAIDGAEKILQEIYELKETFNLKREIDIHCYFANVDKRLSITNGAIKAAQNTNKVIKHLSAYAIRHCAEIPKSIQGLNNIYSLGKSSKATEDYQELLISFLSKEGIMHG